MQTAEGSERQRVAKLTEIAYMMVKETIAFKKFPEIVNMEKRHGVDLGNTYHNKTFCAEISSIIGQTLENELINFLQEANFFSILTDGSTDSGVQEKELVFVIFISKDGDMQTRFLKLKSVADGSAEGLKKLIVGIFENMGIDYKKKLIGVGADGANVNLGKKKGLVALIKQDIPWVIGVHCLSHRLELSLRDAFKGTTIDTVCDKLMDLYYVYQNSPKKLRELRVLADVLDLQIKKPKKAHGTRWVQHRLDAAQALIRGFEPICKHLESMAAVNDTKSKGILLNLRQFVTHLLFLETMLVPVARLSMAWQKDCIDISHVLTSQRHFKESLEAIRANGGYIPGSDLDKLMNSEQSSSVMFKNITLTHVPQGLSSFKSKVTVYLDKLEQSVHERISSEEGTNKIFNCARVLDTRLWPNDRDDLKAYGNELIQFAAEHYITTGLLDFSSDAAVAEWKSLKIFVSDNMGSLTPQEVWKRLHLFYQDSYPAIAKLCEIFRIYPLSNAAVERCFSTMGKVKTDWRASLGEQSLDALVRIKKWDLSLKNIIPKQQ